jgi:two-component system osmolarity sensor histidine kinase EnvZ
MTTPVPRGGLYYRFNRFLERHLPARLYARSLIIVIAPLVVLQTIMGGIILDRHWDNVTKVLGRSLAREIGLLTELYDKSDKSETALQTIEYTANHRLNLTLDIIRNGTLPPPISRVFYSLVDDKLTKYLVRETGKPFWIDSSADDGKVDVRVEVEKGLIFRILADDERTYATGTHWLLLSMLFSTLLLGLVAALFMRNQVRPIVDLARAAQDFGLGRDTDEFRPRGAAEVRQAGEAFLDMKRRIARHVEQRTAMLAGVSHDLRTILTRFKLELAVLGDSPKVKPLQDDVREMQDMLEAYLAFVRGDEGEQAVATNVAELAAEVAQAMSRSGTGVSVAEVPSLPVRLRPHSFRRLLANVLANALRHGTRVVLSGELRDGRLWLHVDDDGPGIAPESREEVFKPFVRLDTARNLDATGSGLGLSIALDIAHAHGGDILLDDSPHGGLRATIKIPV